MWLYISSSWWLAVSLTQLKLVCIDVFLWSVSKKSYLYLFFLFVTVFIFHCQFQVSQSTPAQQVCGEICPISVCVFVCLCIGLADSHKLELHFDRPVWVMGRKRVIDSNLYVTRNRKKERQMYNLIFNHVNQVTKNKKSNHLK